MTLRQAGLCVHVSSLTGACGIGNFGAGARELIDWMAEAGFAVWQFLPLGPTGFGNSPYQLLSAFAGNPLYVDPHGLVELGLLDTAEARPAGSASPSTVDFAAVIAAQQRRFRIAAARFAAAPASPLRDEFDAFCARHEETWLGEYALYATLKAAHDEAPWTAWPEPFRDREPAAIEEWRGLHRAELEAERLIQFVWHRQWAEVRAYAHDRGIRLFGDVPIYLPLDCADAWSARELLDLDTGGAPIEVAGVPPDYFSDEGQRWGNPLYDWERHAADGFRWWIARLTQAFERLDMVRLDHFRGFEAYWAIPAGKPAREGCWRPGPGAALFEAIRASLGDCEIIAEDLGIITESVTALRKQFGMPGMQVLQFMVAEPEFDAQAIEEDCVCYTGTHDNDTVVGWFNVSARRDPGELDALQHTVRERLRTDDAGVADAMIGLAFSTRAELAVIPVQDVLGLDSSARMNTPGSTEDNWRWRLAPGQLDAAAAARMRAMIESFGRQQAAGDSDDRP